MDLTTASFILSVGLIIVLIYVLSFWQIFYKAGYESWKCIIPIYNLYIMTKIAGQPIWVFILLIIPGLSVVGSLFLSLGVAKMFGKGTAFALIGLFLFTFFGYMYLGWGDSEYVGEKA
jgi:hypothetical protein